jgi:hypothetical protein
VPNEVVVIGTLGEEHRGNTGYDLPRLELLLRELEPHRVLCEIPPDRFEESWDQFVYSGKVTEPRVREFPEITEALFPLALEGRTRLSPCSAWTPEVAERRQSLLAQWEHSRPADFREVDEARSKALQQIAEEGLERDPLRVNSERYDAIIAEAMEPYQRLFDRDLATGGWKKSNRAHFSLIAAELKRCAGEELRVVILFSSWNRYRLLELLARYPGIELLSVEEALKRPSPRP